MKYFAALTNPNSSAFDTPFGQHQGTALKSTFSQSTENTMLKFKQTLNGSVLENKNNGTRLVKDAPPTGNKVEANLTNRLLVVRGTNSNDNIKITLSGANVRVGNFKFKLANINKIIVAGHGGDDTLSVGASIQKQTVIYGGSGDDMIFGGGEKDIIYGGRGADTISGRGGNDFIFGGAETDTLKGGGGTNRLRQGSPSRKYSMNSLEQQVLTLTNAERAKNGLGALTLNRELAKGAKIHSTNIKKRIGQTTLQNGFDHNLWGVQQPTFDTRADFVGFDWSSIRENIAAGQTSAAQVVADWMASPGHRVNILSADVTSLGVGIVNLPDGTPVYTQFFGTEV